MDELLFEQNLNTVKELFEKGIIKNRLSQIKIHNFRRFAADSEINFTFPLTVIVGKNGSGKTTMMKAIKLLSGKEKPQAELFETVLDDGGFDGADISYKIDGKEFQYKRLRQNEWKKEGNIPEKFSIKYIQTKTMVGAIDKSFLYDSIGKSTSRIQQVEYVIKQSKKIKQNPQSNSERKQRHFISDSLIKDINYVLQENIKSIEVIRHKYYSGTWGTSIIFNDGTQYSEYNSGSGEFVVTSMLDQIDKVSEGSLLLLDEPEISLHPGAQRRLINYILAVIKKKKIQVIITTHSTSMVEGLPDTSIKCFRKVDDSHISIEENVLYKNAFLELEANIIDKRYVFVEDTMAKAIITRILEQEKLSDLIETEVIPGGASNIKKYTLLTYSKTGVDNRYIMFDGDQQFVDVPDFSTVPEAEKTGDYYKTVFKQVTGIRADTLDWGIDANRKAGRRNEDQLNELMIKYLQFFTKYVYFLPKKIPEEMIYDEKRLKIILGDEGFPDVSAEKDAKAKLKKIADEMGQELDQIEYQLVYWFVKQKNEDYNAILESLKQILGDHN